MLDSNVVELFKYMVLVMGILLILGVVIIGFQLNTISDYQNRVNDTVARYGGLTTAAVTELNSISKHEYNGIYSIDTAKSETGAKPYGTAVDYTIDIAIKNPLAATSTKYGSAVIDGTRTGTAVTQVRQPSAN